MCWVMPPASPATTFAWRIASSSDVLPWSTWPITVTTGARGCSFSGLAAAGCAKNDSSKPVSCVEAELGGDLRRGGQRVDRGVDRQPSCRAPSACAARRAPSSRAGARARRPRSSLGSEQAARSDARAAAGRFDASRRLAAVRTPARDRPSPGGAPARPTAWRASVSCSRRFTTSRTQACAGGRSDRDPAARSGARGEALAALPSGLAASSA